MICKVGIIIPAVACFLDCNKGKMRHAKQIFNYYRTSCNIAILLSHRPNCTPPPHHLVFLMSALHSERRLQSGSATPTARPCHWPQEAETDVPRVNGWDFLWMGTQERVTLAAARRRIRLWEKDKRETVHHFLFWTLGFCTEYKHCLFKN